MATRTKPKPAIPTAVMATLAAVDPPPVYAVVLEGLLPSRTGAAKDFRLIVPIPAPTTERLYTHEGRTYEYVGMDAHGRRLYRDHTRPYVI